MRIAPQIDSVGWLRDNGGVQIYINTHDPKNNTWYYRWTTEETWEFHSTYYTSLDFLRNDNTEIIGVKFRRPDQAPELDSFTPAGEPKIQSSLILGSSKKLSIDSIHKPLIYIEPRSWKVSVLYSVLVKQYALTKEEYEFLDKMKKNTEETGSFFGRQPSELKGNIQCITKSRRTCYRLFWYCQPPGKRTLDQPAGITATGSIFRTAIPIPCRLIPLHFIQFLMPTTPA